MANIFNITWSNVTENLTPWFYRRTNDDNESKLLPYLRSMISPIQTITSELNILRSETLTFLNYTGQHKSIEEFLNDNYDLVLRRIYITENNIASIDAINLYISGEPNTTPISMYLSGEVVTVPITFYLSGEGLTSANFTIHMPSSISYDSILLDSRLRDFISASKQYNIIIF